jgi:transposase
MPRYKALSEDLRWVLVHMYHKRNLTVQDIEKQTSVKARTIQKILKLFHDTGKVLPAKRHSSRPFKLNQNNVEVSSKGSTCIITLIFFIVKYVEACVSHSPDAYLDELRTQLEEACGVKVHESTVWRALKRRGFTLKKVSIRAFMLVCLKSQSDYDPDYKGCYGAK